MIEDILSQRALPLFAYINLSLIIVFLYLSRRYFASLLRKAGKKSMLLLFAVFLTALFIRAIIVPHHHRFFIDETLYIEAAKNIAYYFRSFISAGAYPKQIGWPSLLAIPFLIFGAGNYVAIYLTVILGSAAVFPAFFLIFMLFRDAKLAIAGSFFLAIMPLHAVYSGTAETIIASVLFILATMLLLVMWAEEKEFKLGCLAFFLLLFTIQIRLENLLIIIPVAAYFFLFNVKINQNERKKYFYLSLISLPFFASYLFQLIKLKDFYDTAYNKDLSLFGYSSLIGKLHAFFTPKYGLFSLLIIGFFLIGVFSLYKKNKKALLFLLSWSVTYFCFYAFYSYSDDFHALPGLIALIPAAAGGFIAVSSYISAKLKVKKRYFIVAFAALALVLFFMSFKIPGNQEYMLETMLMGSLKKDVPGECIIVAEIPSIATAATELAAVRTGYFLDKIPKNPAFFENKCFIYIEDMYCYRNPGANAAKRCSLMHSEFNLKKFKEYNYLTAAFYLYNISG